MRRRSTAHGSTRAHPLGEGPAVPAQRLKLERVELPIGNLGCPGAAAPLARWLERLDGVREATVNPVSERAVVVFDPGRVSIEQLVRTLEDRQLEVGRSVARWRLPLAGLDGANSAHRLERAVQGVAGVHAGNVDLVGRTLTVEYSPRRTDLAVVRDAIARQGFDVLLPPAVAGLDAGPDVLTQQEAEYRDLMRRFWFSTAIAAPTLLLSHPTWFGWESSLLFTTLGSRTVWATLATLALIGLLYSGRHFFRALRIALSHGTADASMLVALAVAVAWAYSALWVVLPEPALPASPAWPLYDLAIGVVALALLGRALEVRAQAQAARPIARLRALLPPVGRVRRRGREVGVPREEIVTGDVVVVAPGERIPADGQVIEGSARTDLSDVTGERRTLDRGVGDRVLAGSRNLGRRFTMQATRVGKDTLIRWGVDLASEAQGTKAPIQRRLDAVSKAFTPGVLIVAIVGFMGWYTLGPEPAVHYAVRAFLVVLIAASPRALALGTPSAVAAGIGRAVRDGVLVRSAKALDAARRVDTVVVGPSPTQEEPDLTRAPAFAALRRMGLDVIHSHPAPGRGRAPQPAAELVTRLRAAGRQVAMVGNVRTDAAAMSLADVGIGLGTGVDVATEAADITLLTGRMDGAVTAIALSRRTMRAIRQNVIGALGYNAVAVPVALGLLYPVTGVLLPPIVATAAMVLSSLTVAANAARPWCGRGREA